MKIETVIIIILTIAIIFLTKHRHIEKLEEKQFVGTEVCFQDICGLYL